MCFVKFILKYFILFDTSMNRIVLVSLILCCILQVCRNTIGFCIFLYPVTLWNSLVSFKWIPCLISFICCWGFELTLLIPLPSLFFWIKLLSGIICFQPEERPLVFLIWQVCFLVDLFLKVIFGWICDSWQIVSFCTLNMSSHCFLLICYNKSASDHIGVPLYLWRRFSFFAILVS